MNIPQYIDEKEVARITGRALSTLRNERFNRRGIPYAKVGRSIRYRLDDVIQFMESCRVQTNFESILGATGKGGTE
jgi:phage terminase Nu1 subunit (DNA packaging protein)